MYERTQARSQGGGVGGGCRVQGGATKSGQNGVFVGRLKGVRFKKSTFCVQMVHFWRFRTSPDSILATGVREHFCVLGLQAYSLNKNYLPL